MLVVNRLRGKVTSVAVSVPGTSSARRELLDDLVAAHGRRRRGDGPRAGARAVRAWLVRARASRQRLDRPHDRAAGRRKKRGHRGDGFRSPARSLRRDLGRRPRGAASAGSRGSPAAWPRFARRGERVRAALAPLATGGRARRDALGAGGGRGARRRRRAAARSSWAGRGADVGRARPRGATRCGSRSSSRRARSRSTRARTAAAMVARVREAGGAFGFNARSCRIADLRGRRGARPGEGRALRARQTPPASRDWCCPPTHSWWTTTRPPPGTTRPPEHGQARRGRYPKAETAAPGAAAAPLPRLAWQRVRHRVRTGLCHPTGSQPRCQLSSLAGAKSSSLCAPAPSGVQLE